MPGEYFRRSGSPRLAENIENEPCRGIVRAIGERQPEADQRIEEPVFCRFKLPPVSLILTGR